MVGYWLLAIGSWLLVSVIGEVGCFWKDGSLEAEVGWFLSECTSQPKLLEN